MQLLTKHYAAPGIIQIPGVGFVFDSDATVPTDGTAGYAPGAIFIDNDAAGVSAIKINVGTFSSCDFNTLNGGIDLSTLVTTATELNLLSGLTATAAEINRSSKLSTRLVTIAPGGADSTTTLTLAAHDGKTLVIDNATKALTVNLPAATGSGARYRAVLMTSITNGAGNSITFVATGAHMFGIHWVLSDGAAAVLGYAAGGATSINFNGTTKGGIKGDIVEIEDVATSVLIVRVMTQETGTEATSFG